MFVDCLMYRYVYWYNALVIILVACVRYTVPFVQYENKCGHDNIQYMSSFPSLCVHVLGDWFPVGGNDFFSFSLLFLSSSHFNFIPSLYSIGAIRLCSSSSNTKYVLYVGCHPIFKG